jgi:hypothetical protein
MRSAPAAFYHVVRRDNRNLGGNRVVGERFHKAERRPKNDSAVKSAKPAQMKAKLIA